MEDLVRMKTGFKLITDINKEIAQLCTEKNIMTAEYNSRIQNIDDRLAMLRQTKEQLSREMARM